MGMPTEYDFVDEKAMPSSWHSLALGISKTFSVYERLPPILLSPFILPENIE